MANYYDMTVNQLRHLVSQNEAKITKTFKAIEKTGLYSQAQASYVEHKVNKPVSSMTKGELLNTLYRQHEFKTHETATAKGTYRAVNNARKVLASKGIRATNKQTGQLFKTFDKMVKNDKSLKSYKYETIKDIADKVKAGMSYDDIIENANEMLEDSYKNREQEYNENTDFSEF